MSKIKKLGELRKLIEENDGIIHIGRFDIKYSSGADIDFRLDSNLIMWIGSGSDDDELLDGLFHSVDSKFETKKGDGKDEVAELKDQKSKLEKKILEQGDRIEKLVKLYDESKKDLGKVEAYEKLLIGRTVSIGE